MNKIALLCLSIITFLSFPAIGQENVKKLSEEELVKEVISKNFDLQSLNGQIEIAHSELIIASKPNNLTLTQDVQALDFTNLINNSNFQANMGVSYDFLMGDQISLKKDIALLAIDQIKLDIYNKTREKVLLAKQSYDELLYKTKLTELREIYLKHSNDIFEATNKQYLAGDIAKYDVFRAELEKNKALLSLNISKKEVKTIQYQISYLINSDNKNIIPSGHFEVPDYQEINIDQKINTYVIDHPELKVFNLQLQSEIYKLGLAHYGVLPTLSSRITLGNQGINASVDLPIPTFYRQQGEISLSKANTNFLQSRYEARKREIIFEANKAYQQFILSFEAVNNFSQTIISQSNILQELSLKRLQAGEGTMLEVLEASRTRYENDNEYARLIFEARKNHHYLEYIIGGDLID